MSAAPTIHDVVDRRPLGVMVLSVPWYSAAQVAFIYINASGLRGAICCDTHWFCADVLHRGGCCSLPCSSAAGKRIRCSRLDGPGVLLLGDAAHAVTPVFGQGANSALESCKVLGEVLQEAQGDLDQVPGAFTAARLADMHALNELDAKAYSFFR